MTEFYDLKPLDSQGNRLNLEQLRNKVVIVVNVASLCGFTPQYTELQKLYEKYQNNGLEILGFPCNQFRNQEPDDVVDICKFTRSKFGVTFPIMGKVYVNGEKEDPLYTFLKEKKKGPLGFKGVRWNFEKFVIDKKGNVVERFASEVTPLQFEGLVQNLLEH